MANSIEYKDIIAFHPGYYIQELIDDMEITQAEFAMRLGTTAKTISELVNGIINISNDLALKLSNMLGTSLDIWLNLQTTYDAKVLEIQKEKELDAQKKILDMIDYSYFVKLKVVNKAVSVGEKINNLREFFKISDLNILKNPDFLVNYRTATSSEKTVKNIVNSRAWLQTAINIGKTQHTETFDSQKLKSFIPEIRAMTTQKPNMFLSRLREIFNQCGVVFVLLPHLKNSAINGAVKWLGADKVILALNDRRKDADTFWFSLFHEIKHILQQKHTITFINGSNIDLINKQLEDEADRFSQNTLISEKDFRSFVMKHDFSKHAIVNYAKKIGIHPGILVGRLQHEKYIAQNLCNELKEKYTIIIN